MQAIVLLLATGLPVFALAAVIGHRVESLKPARSALRRADLVLDATYGTCHAIIAALLRPVAALASAAAVKAVGGGIIALPDHGIAGVAAFCIYLLTWDLLEYAAHRVQHAIPALWAMHSLHHSEQAYNIMTSMRHFWAEGAIKAVTIYLLLAIIFDAPPLFTSVAVAIYFLNHCCAHLNVRVSLGRFALYVMNPQFHRLHHSFAVQHLDRNFADLLPLWDVLFRTDARPAADEFPDTGLPDGGAPRSLWQALVWPFRRVA